MSKTDKVLDDLHTELATTLLDKVRSGTAKASDLNVARQFLRDNGIAGVPVENSPLKNLMDELPFTEEEVVKKFNGTSST
jgi:Zn-dependent membrane protease YugP